MSFVTIDFEHYPRRDHFEHFLNMAYPYAGVTAEMDVTDLVAFCKERKYSFYLVFLHAAALAADGVREFRQRICGGQIHEYPHCPTSHIELLDNGTYCYCTLRHQMPLDEFMAYAEEVREACRQKASIEEEPEVESMYFISTMPWVHYTNLIQPVCGGEDSNPRITWGKFEADAQGRKHLPVTVLAHHSLVDGIHIAQFYRNLESEIRKIVET